MKTENRKLKKYRLGEIGDIITGKTPSTFDIENYGEEYMFISPTDLHNGYKIEKTLKNISQKGFDSIKTNTIKGQSVLVGCIGWDMGNVGYTEKKCATNQQINSITNFKEFANPLYTYYWLKNKKDFLFSVASVTRTPILNKSSFSDIVIPLPELQNQMDVAKILSSLDDKIALNSRINAKLEQMAKRLYDHWFVQFDFPNADGKPYKSSGGKMIYSDVLKREIPAGWEVKRLGEIISKIDSGKRPSGGIDKSLKYGIPSLGEECIDDLGVFDFSGTPFIDFSYKEKMTNGKIENNDILIYKDGAYVGKTTLFRDNFPYKEAFVNEHVFLIHAKKEEFEEYLYFTLTQKTYFQIMQNLGKAKAAQPGLNREDLQNILLIIPNNNLISDFNKKVEPLFAQVFNNAKTTGKLTALRDKLLPLLMNGQVEVR
ncbi:MAG: restriction endonuclease subunit S [Treponema sp.]|nr:restriction endonuclease subunit S [Treponema sp.]